MRQLLHDPQPEPSRENVAERPESGRDRGGRFAPGNRAALKHGAYAAGQRPPELTALVGDLDGFRAGLITDQGGEQDMEMIRRGYVEKLTGVESVYRLLVADVMLNGIFTKRGRTRSTFHALLAVIEKWDRLAQRLGMGRRQKDISSMSIEDFIAATATQTQGVDDEQAHNQTETDTIGENPRPVD